MLVSVVERTDREYLQSGRLVDPGRAESKKNTTQIIFFCRKTLDIMSGTLWPPLDFWSVPRRQFFDGLRMLRKVPDISFKILTSFDQSRAKI